MSRRRCESADSCGEGMTSISVGFVIPKISIKSIKSSCVGQMGLGAMQNIPLNIGNERVQHTSFIEGCSIRMSAFPTVHC